MEYYVGLDVSLNTIFVCIVDEKGKVIKEQDMGSQQGNLMPFVSK